MPGETLMAADVEIYRELYWIHWPEGQRRPDVLRTVRHRQRRLALPAETFTELERQGCAGVGEDGLAWCYVRELSDGR